jgi:hypothetical protein
MKKMLFPLLACALVIQVATHGAEPPPLPPMPADLASVVEPEGMTVRIKLEPDIAKIFTITWSNLPPIYTNGYRIETSQSLADGWSVSGTSTSNVRAITFTTRTGPNSSYYRVSPLVGSGDSPVYILQWKNGVPEIIEWSPPPDTEPDPDPDTEVELALLPIDDAYLQAGTRLNDQFLKVEAANRIAYLKFTVTDLPGVVMQSTLKLLENGDAGSGTFRVWRGSHDNWTELNLTAANAPAKATQVGLYSGAVTNGQTLAIDLGAHVRTNGVYTFIVEQDAGGNDVWFGSRESARSPGLTLRVAP